MTLNAVGVLNAHADLAARMQKPSRHVAGFIGYHMRTTIEDQRKAGLPTQGTFHPVIPAESDKLPTPAEGEEMARLIGRGLGKAVTYQVTAPMVADMLAAFAFSDGGISSLDDRLLPSPAGFAWLDAPWRVPAADGGFWVRAVSWEFTETWTLDDVVDSEEARSLSPDSRSRLWPCVRIAVWRHDMDAEPGDTARELGSLTLTHIALMPCQVRFIDPGDPAQREASDALIGLFHLLWTYLGMEISVSEKRGIPAGTRKSARRFIRRPEVRVVTLRRARAVSDEPGGHRDVAWTHRWGVDEHYRHRVRPADGHKAAVPEGGDKHCAACGGELFYVHPHVKGPAGLPFARSRRTLMRLARLWTRTWTSAARPTTQPSRTCAAARRTAAAAA